MTSVWTVLRGRLGDRDRGSATVEAVLIIPLAVVATLLVVQFVLVWHGRHVAQSAAQSAARAAAAYRSTAAAGESVGADYLAGVAPTLLPGRSVRVTRDAAAATAAVHADVLTLVPFLTFTVDERATAPVEAFTPPAGAP